MQVFSCEFCEISKNTVFYRIKETQNTKKMKTRELKEKKFEKKVKAIGWVVLVVMFAFLSSTIEVGKW